MGAPCKSSDLDPLPTGLVKDCIDVLVTPIVSIVNLSLSEGCFPTHFKSALVSPLLKKPTFNRDDMKNYRPVSQAVSIHTSIALTHQMIISLHTGNFIQPKPPFSKSTMIFSHRWLTVRSHIDSARPFCCLRYNRPHYSSEETRGYSAIGSGSVGRHWTGLNHI